MAGEMAVALHDRLIKNRWIAKTPSHDSTYELTALGTRELAAHGIDMPPLLAGRRRIACACLDWSERRPHVGGAVGAALLQSALQHKWVLKDLDSRVLRVTKRGEHQLLGRFGLQGRSKA
jgi:hypothetical protein